MPTYEYECLKCKRRFDIFQKMSDEPVKKCLKCDGEMRRLIGTGAGLIFKGSGFYTTDYKNKQNHIPVSGKQNNGTSPKTSANESSNTKSKPKDTKKAS